MATQLPGGSRPTTGSDLLAKEGDDETTAGPMRSRSHRAVIEWAIILMAVVLSTVVLRTYVVQSFYIPSGSMLPTLQIGDRIIVNKLSYRFHDPHRGDVVVFARPPLEDQAYADLVKRVVGLPGETISSSNGNIYIDGKRLSEPWLPPGSNSYSGALSGGDPHQQFDLPGPVKIPAGEYYVMGDNRRYSEDSRFFGPIPRSLIVGRAVAVVWPISHAKGL
ncbi:MAG TPA: signal peptidase I [Acidimicrobiales bacterium]|nr:signal peptidase I [Acidimicrobiales bacterium]